MGSTKQRIKHTIPLTLRSPHPPSTRRNLHSRRTHNRQRQLGNSHPHPRILQRKSQGRQQIPPTPTLLLPRNKIATNLLNRRMTNVGSPTGNHGQFTLEMWFQFIGADQFRGEVNAAVIPTKDFNHGGGIGKTEMDPLSLGKVFRVRDILARDGKGGGRFIKMQIFDRVALLVVHGNHHLVTELTFEILHFLG